MNGRTQEYYVKWLGYDVSENTWEPRKNLTLSDGARELLNAFDRNTAQKTGCLNIANQVNIFI